MGESRYCRNPVLGSALGFFPLWLKSEKELDNYG
jgi:hypothetical protein